MSIATDLTRLQTAKADLKTAIEGKGVTVPSATKIDGYADLVESIPSGGSGIDVDDLATNSAPSGAITLTATRINARAFSAKSITSVNAPNVTNIQKSAFLECTSLTEFNAPLLDSTNGSDIFNGCTSLTTFNAPNWRTCNAGGDLLRNTRITNLHLEKMTMSDSGAFAGMKELVTAVLPLSENNYNGFSGCTKLQKADIKGGASMTNAFNGCTVFDTLVIRNPAMIPLSNINAFNGTCFKNGGTGGTIYIAKDLYDQLGTGSASDYKAATNWSTVDGYGTITWAAIEGSQYENHYVDGTPTT